LLPKYQQYEFGLEKNSIYKAASLSEISQKSSRPSNPTIKKSPAMKSPGITRLGFKPITFPSSLHTSIAVEEREIVWIYPPTNSDSASKECSNIYYFRKFASSYS